MKRPTFFYGYLILATCFCIQGIGVGTYVTFGVFFKPLLAEFGWSRATLSSAHSLTFLIAGMLGILIGRLNDRLGPRLLMTVTGFIYGLGFILMSRLNALWQLYVFYSLIVGVGLSSIDVIALSTTARWFVRRRGMVTGIVKVGTGAGQLIMPLVASLLIAAFDWRLSYIIIGVLAMLLLILVAQLLQRDPARMGLLPDEGVLEHEQQQAAPRDVRRRPVGARAGDVDEQRPQHRGRARRRDEPRRESDEQRAEHAAASRALGLDAGREARNRKMDPPHHRGAEQEQEGPDRETEERPEWCRHGWNAEARSAARSGINLVVS